MASALPPTDPDRRRIAMAFASVLRENAKNDEAETVEAALK